jgi:hypothetical protein
MLMPFGWLAPKMKQNIWLSVINFVSDFKNIPLMTEKSLEFAREIYFDNRKSRFFIKEGPETPRKS